MPRPRSLIWSGPVSADPYCGSVLGPLVLVGGAVDAGEWARPDRLLLRGAVRTAFARLSFPLLQRRGGVVQSCARATWPWGTCLSPPRPVIGTVVALPSLPSRFDTGTHLSNHGQ